jgi:hypothetical protein
MNRDPEAIENLLAWLSHNPELVNSPPLGFPPHYYANHADHPDHQDGLADALDPLDSEELDLALSEFHDLVDESMTYRSFTELGDVPAVQDRFYALLKRRLSAEIEQNPPLFPWETELYEYAAESSDFAPELVPAGVWSAHFKNLALPVPLPESVLANVFAQCQQLVKSSIRDGVKLVQAVEALFPGQSQALNQAAGWVLATPVRSGDAPVLETPEAALSFDSYEQANPSQQMVLTLLAARDLMESLTLTVSTHKPQVEHQWLTAEGWLVVRAEYYPHEADRLRVIAHLPAPGQVTLHGAEAIATTQRTTAGYASVELLDGMAQQPYPIEVSLNGSEQPLTFAVKLAATA